MDSKQNSSTLLCQSECVDSVSGILFIYLFILGEEEVMDWERRVNGGGGDYNLTSSSSGGDGCSSMGGGFSYIQHPVSKFDTLAGVAIRYGVEVK